MEELTLRLARIWWAGFKVLCRWCVFGIVIWVLTLPIVGSFYLLGPGSILSVAVCLLTLPIPFYLASKYLCLLEDSRVVAARAAETPSEVGGQRAYGLGTKILVSIVVAFLSGFFLLPSPDPLSGLFLGVPAALLCGATLLILSRFQFVKSASNRKQTWVCVLVCLAVMLIVLGYVVLIIAHTHAHVSPDTPVVSVSR